MRKVEPCLSRPGKKGERVATCVGGRVISDITIADDTSMVVKAPTINQELYVLQKDKFAKQWDPEGRDLDQSNPVNRLLTVQGFKLYRPKPTLRWTYMVTCEDASLIPTRWFHAAWGALQPVQEGDCLAMPAPEDRATEVYLMPVEVLTCYEEVSDGIQHPGDHLTQQEMLDIFSERIRDHGSRMRKAKPGMMRPGVRGDRVVTYVNGQVISDVVIKDDDRMVVRAPTVDHEEYVLDRDKFTANWESEGEPLDEQNMELAKLAARGFRWHQPKPVPKYVYRLGAADVQLVPTGWFVAPWGNLQQVAEGEYLAMSKDRVKEITLMPKEVLQCYEGVRPESRLELSDCVEDPAGPKG